MKKIIVVLVITSILIATVILEQVFVQSTLNSLIEQINIFETAISQTEDINTTKINILIDNIDVFWTEKEQLLCLSINHNDLNQVGEEIKRVKAYVKQNDKKECMIELEALIFFANSYKHVMEITPQNFF